MLSTLRSSSTFVVAAPRVIGSKTFTTTSTSSFIIGRTSLLAGNINNSNKMMVMNNNIMKRSLAIGAGELSALLEARISKGGGAAGGGADVAEIGNVISVGDGIARVVRCYIFIYSIV
jgi:hypothetical protein